MEFTVDLQFKANSQAAVANSSESYASKYDLQEPRRTWRQKGELRGDGDDCNVSWHGRTKANNSIYNVTE